MLALLLAFACTSPPHPLLPSPQQQPQDPSGLQRRTWSIDGTDRQALVHAPPSATAEPCPLVFVFHGHGGRMANVARSFHLHDLWPEAVVVYPQGLPTATSRDPEGARPGWQNRAGIEGDRDLRFVDAMIASLQRELRIDGNRVHATGHSNGGGFTYLLLATRGDLFASFAPSAAGAAGAAAAARDRTLPPRPVLHVAGRNDQIVPFAQQQRTIDALLAARAAGPGEDWAEVPGLVLHRTASGAHVATMIHDGTHQFPAEAPERIAGFFRATPRPNPWVTEPVRGPGLVQHVYPSPAAGTEVSYHVYLPPGYGDDPAQRFPVVYWLHGSGGGIAGITPVATLFDAAIARGAIPPVLVVFPNGLPNGMWCDAVAGPPVESVLVREIVPRVDRLFRTIAAREGRIVEGFSMGGYGALRLGFVHRELFGAASSLAGGPLQREFVAAPRVNEERREQVLRQVYGGDLAVFRRQSPWQLAIDHAAALRAGTRIRVVVGSSDETLPANRELHGHLVELGIPHDYVELDGVRHDPLQLLEALGERFWQFHRGAFVAGGR
jgi:poly(3-hydroxybutyrate) depolymerase